MTHTYAFILPITSSGKCDESGVPSAAFWGVADRLTDGELQREPNAREHENQSRVMDEVPRSGRDGPGVGRVGAPFL